MSVLSTQIIHDGARNTVLKVDLMVDTGNIGPTVILNPMSQFVDPLTPTKQYRIDYINYIIQDGLSVDLWWEATAPTSIVHLEGRGHVDMEKYSGLTNNAGAGKTGSIMLSTDGWSTGLALSGSFTLEAIKQ